MKSYTRFAAVVATFFFAWLGIAVCSLPLYGQLSGELKMYNGRPTIHINGNPTYPMIYALTDVPGGRWSWEEVPRYNMKKFCGAGVNLVQVDISFDHVWREDGEIVLDTIQRQLKGVVDNCPSAAVMIRFHVTPPKWWTLKFPEENTVYADTRPMPDISWGIQRLIEDDEENPTRTSLASEKWRIEAGEKVEVMLEKLAKLPEANALFSIQIAGGVYGEWHYWGFINNEPDMSEPMQNYFRGWLARKYKTDKSLQQSWSNTSVTLQSAPLPTLKERRNSMAGIFRDPVRERNLIDYYQAQHQVVVDDILYFCRIVKTNWPRPILTGAFYGYFYSVFGREAAGGHLELQQVLSSPDIDFLCSPNTYYPQSTAVGEPYRSRSLIHSVLLHGKLWLDEMDQQPPLLPLKDSAYSVSLEKSIAVTRRNTLFTLTQGQGLWFYDFGPSGFNGGPRLKDHGVWGWWDEPSIHENIGQMKKIADARLHTPYISQADVLLVHDSRAFYYLGSDRRYTSLSHRINNWLPPALFRSGAVHDVIDLGDLSLIDLSRYKVIVFANTFVLTDAERKFITGKVARDNRHLIWIYAPGYSNDTKLDHEFIWKTTGIKVRPVSISLNNPPVIRYEDGQEEKYPVMPESITPFFSVADDKAEAVATIDGSNEILSASKKMAESTSWFFGLPSEDPGKWRSIFRKAGAHIYTDSGDVVYNGGGLLVVHTADGGKRTITLRNGTNVSLDLRPNSTVAIDNESGELLLD